MSPEKKLALQTEKTQIEDQLIYKKRAFLLDCLAEELFEVYESLRKKRGLIKNWLYPRKIEKSDFILGLKYSELIEDSSYTKMVQLEPGAELSS